MDNIYHTKSCWRCDKLQPETNFLKRYNHLRNERLHICNDCISEEAKILGESKAEIIGIYTNLQVQFKHRINRGMYRRFWEKALYHSTAQDLRQIS